MLSKNNIGIISTLILVILLSQSRVFDFLIDTALGRFILILFILGISHMHKILGVVAVLFIIIMINQSEMRLFEGMAGNISNASEQIQPQPDKGSLSTKKPAREGFNMIDREGTMLKGKRSNEISVSSNSRTQTDDVEPSDKSVFTDAYTSV